MNKVFFILLFPLNILAQQFPSDLWHPGLLVTNDGDTIKGDLKYGAKRPNKDASIHLFAQKINLKHPVTKQNITIKAKPPKDKIWDACIKQY